MKNEVTNSLQIQVGQLRPCSVSPQVSIQVVAHIHHMKYHQSQ